MSKETFGLTSFINKSFSFIKKNNNNEASSMSNRDKRLQVLSDKCFHSSHTKEFKQTGNTFWSYHFLFVIIFLLCVCPKKSIPSIFGGYGTSNLFWPSSFYFTISNLSHSGLRICLLGYRTVLAHDSSTRRSCGVSESRSASGACNVCEKR